MSKKSSKSVTDKSEPDYGPQDLGGMSDKREAIAKKARESRKALQDEVNVDDESMAVLSDADDAIIGSGKKPEEREEKATDNKEQARETKSDDAGVASERVDVVIYGRTYSVPKQDVERAGGIHAYQRDRASRIRMTEASATLQRAQRREQEIRKREEALNSREKQLSERSSQEQGSEESPEPPSKGAQRSEGDHHEKVKSIVNRIFSGKVDDAEQAIEEILSETSQHVDEDAIVAKAVQKLREQEAQERQQAHQQQQDEEQSRADAERAMVNRVMREEFSDVLENDLKLKVARAYFIEKRSKPENTGRDVSDIAREAGEQARKIRLDDPEAERRIRETEKRDMPRESSARNRKAPEDDTPSVASPSQHIERMRKARGLASH